VGGAVGANVGLGVRRGVGFTVRVGLGVAVGGTLGFGEQKKPVHGVGVGVAAVATPENRAVANTTAKTPTNVRCI
jgi:hypothetical protein